MADIIEEAHKRRYKFSDDDDKGKQAILMSDSWI